MSEPRFTVTETVRHWGTCTDDGNIPYSLVSFMKELQKAVSEIPDEYINSASIDFEPDYELGEYYRSCRITYKRPETAEETWQRVNEERAHWNEQLNSARGRLEYCTKKLDKLPVNRRV